MIRDDDKENSSFEENSSTTRDEELAASWDAMDDNKKSQEDLDADALAASWGQETGEEEQKILSQSEIDNLLGIDQSPLSHETSGGIYALVHSDMVHYERLPMLEIVFDRLVRLLSTSLRNFTSDNVDVSLDTISSARFSDYLNSIPLPAMIGVFKAREWNDYGLLTVDSSLIYSIVDVLLGGRKGTALMRIEGRPYTTIERKLIQRLMQLILDDFKQSFHPLCDVHFDFDRLETNPTFASIARPANAAVVAKLRIEMLDRGGKIEFLIPYATIEPIRNLLLQSFMGEKFGQDSIWETHLAHQLFQTDFTLDAILDQVNLPLKDVLALQKGSHISLNATPESSVQLKCGDVHLFSGSVGHKGKNIAVKIDHELQNFYREKG